MQEPKPSGIIQFPDQHERDLRKKVADQSTNAGHPATAASVNPADDSNIKNIQDFIKKTTGHTLNSVGTALGEEESFPIETASGSNVVSILNKNRGIRERIKGFLSREKAA